VLAAAGVALAIVASQGGSPKPVIKPHSTTSTTTPTVPSQGPTGGIALSPTAPSRVANTPRAHWMGMEIVSSPLGTVISTVAAGSEGQAAGFEPGDVITAIGNEAINSPRQIRAAVAHIALGDRVQITIDRGSTILTTALTLRNRPTIQP
jgi:general secretion pathway protein C